MMSPAEARVWGSTILALVAVSCLAVWCLTLGVARAADTALPQISVEQRTTEPLLVADRPYEDMCLNYLNVIQRDGVWHMWYAAYDHNYRNDGDAYLCYARSSDGVRWEKPNMGLVSYAGNKDNNILISGRDTGGFAGHTVFLDEAAPAEERFKVVFIRFKNNSEWWVYGGVSPDGIHWNVLSTPLMKRNSDTQNVCFRDGDVYRLYVRSWSGGLWKGLRTVSYTESATFGGFPKPVEILAPDSADPKDMHFYNSAASKLPDGQILMLPSAYYKGEDVTRVHAAISSDGKAFTRVSRTPIAGLGTGFDSKGLYVAPGLVPADGPGRYWVYYLGTGVKHDDNVPGRAIYEGGVGRFLLVLGK